MQISLKIAKFYVKTLLTHLDYRDSLFSIKQTTSIVRHNEQSYITCLKLFLLHFYIYQTGNCQTHICCVGIYNIHNDNGIIPAFCNYLKFHQPTKGEIPRETI